jgi:HSP20 family protein
MSTQSNKERATIAPPVDIFENKDEILILADLPGVTPEGLKVSLENDQLTINAQRQLGPEGRKGEPVEYRRVFVVPHGIDADKIGANLQAGVLRLTLPKPAALKPRQIEVRAG